MDNGASFYKLIYQFLLLQMAMSLILKLKLSRDMDTNRLSTQDQS